MSRSFTETLLWRSDCGQEEESCKEDSQEEGQAEKEGREEDRDQEGQAEEGPSQEEGLAVSARKCRVARRVIRKGDLAA